MSMTVIKSELYVNVL